MKKAVFIKNAATMTVTSLLLRTVGIFFRIYMAGKIGAEGMGLYQLIFSVYVLAATFASSGVSTAVTRLVTDELACGTAKSARHILRRAILISVGVGVVSAVAVFFSAGFIAGTLLGDARAADALRILPLSLPFMGVSACLRGYFMARRKAGSPSRAQLLEQGVRIGVIVTLFSRAPVLTVGYGCFAILAGDVLAEGASCLYMALGYLWDRRKVHTPTDNTPYVERPTRQLLKIAAPITAGRYLNSLLRTIENVLVPMCLMAYTASREASLAQFGMIKGMALPLLFFPS
ncbi:MAG: oligosaccharide flippase family protein, partial [Oscillospiraceae bacterium]|nr:oligosaccharide flippase family protein [Oscillospiraceae bacterium]